MASIRQEVRIEAAPEAIWDAVRDVGALHTRLVPGFVIDTTLEEGARLVTFANGMVVREVIVDLDDDARRAVWSAKGTAMTHHNASVQVFPDAAGSRVVWIADLLPDDMKPAIAGMIAQGLEAMKRAMEQAQA